MVRKRVKGPLEPADVMVKYVTREWWRREEPGVAREERGRAMRRA